MTATMVETFEQWAIVEIMGHKKFAGFVTEQTARRQPRDDRPTEFLRRR